MQDPREEPSTAGTETIRSRGAPGGAGGIRIRTALLLVLIAVPAFGFLPTAHACAATGATPIAERYYVTTGGRSTGPAALRSDPAGVDTGVDVRQCFWSGAGATLWQETNGVAGLQTQAGPGCAADTVVVGGNVAITRQCAL